MHWNNIRIRSKSTRGRSSIIRIRGCSLVCWRRFSFWRIIRKSYCRAARRRRELSICSREILAPNNDKFYHCISRSKGWYDQVLPSRLISRIKPLLLPKLSGIKRKHWKVVIIPLNMPGVRVQNTRLYTTLNISKKNHLKCLSWGGSTNNLAVWRKNTENCPLSTLRSSRKPTQSNNFLWGSSTISKGKSQEERSSLSVPLRTLSKRISLSYWSKFFQMRKFYSISIRKYLVREA